MNRERLRVWSRRVGLWLPALLFFLLNLVALAVYQVAFADEVAVARDAVESARGRLDTLSEERLRLESHLGAIEATEGGIQGLYRDVLSTESQRLTAVIREVNQLAQEANLVPRTVSFPEERLEEYGLRERSFVFTVEGTYFDLRKLINSLELSDSFLTLEEVELAGVEGGNLRISLRLSTLFALQEAFEAAQSANLANGASAAQEAAP